MYRRIVVGTDGSPTAREAVKHAAELARLTGATLHLVSARHEPALAASPEFIASGFDAAGAAAEAATNALAEAVDQVRPLGIAVETHDPPGPPAACIVEVAKALDADLVVVGNRGMHGTRRILGSIPNSVSHHAHCSVLVVQTC